MEKKVKTILLWVTIFSIAMAFLESAVVVYLRAIYYPEGFQFPLASLDQRILITELFREVATIVMLLGAGVISGKNFGERLAYFIYCFAIWDIFYYVFLKLLLGWPESFLTWDLLFLIPVVWVGPVICPILLSITMILLAGVIIYYNRKMTNMKIKSREWLVLIFGSIVVIVSFTWDYSTFLIGQYSLSELLSLIGTAELNDLNLLYIPGKFIWWLFWVGELIILSGIGIFWWRNRSLHDVIDQVLRRA